MSERVDPAALARAICLRGVVGTFAQSINFADGRDDFNGPWEELPLPVRNRWFILAGVVERVALTPGWSGALSCIEAGDWPPGQDKTGSGT